jgi:hypothetical protein
MQAGTIPHSSHGPPLEEIKKKSTKYKAIVRELKERYIYYYSISHTFCVWGQKGSHIHDHPVLFACLLFIY